MLTLIVSTLWFIPAADRDAPLPDRWLLQLAPKDLTKLPDKFWKNSWLESYSPRGGGGWVERTKFAHAANEKAAEVTITRGATRDGQFLKARAAPMAVHGPIVEFDRKLWTVALTNRRTDEGKEIEYLTLGAAVEIKPNVWYQAYSEEFSDGKVRVTEIRADFASDPRKTKDGKANVQLFIRMLTERRIKGVRTL